MTTLGSSVHTIGNLLHTHDLYDHLRAVPPAIAPYADPLNFCSPRIAEPVGPWETRGCARTNFAPPTGTPRGITSDAA